MSSTEDRTRSRRFEEGVSVDDFHESVKVLLYTYILNLLSRKQLKWRHVKNLSLPSLYKEDFNYDPLSMQLGTFSTNNLYDLTVSSGTYSSSEVSAFRSVRISFPDSHAATNAVRESSSRALQHLKSCLRATMSQTKQCPGTTHTNIIEIYMLSLAERVQLWPSLEVLIN